jgi:hypothetical protein
MMAIKLGSKVDGPYRIVPLANASAEQKRIYQSWLAVSLTPQ